MRVLVTGASGFIGRTLVNYLVNSECEPFLLLEKNAIQKHPIPSESERGLSIDQLYYGDLRERTEIAEIVNCVKPDSVIHLAAAGVTDPFLDYTDAVEHNILGTLSLLHALFSDQGLDPTCQRVIVARTPGEASNMNVYAASKAAAWAFCSLYSQNKGWPIVGAVIHQAYGPGQPAHTLVPAAIKSAKQGSDFPMTSGTQLRDWIYVDDAAQGLIAMLRAKLTPGSSVDLGTGEGTTVLDVVNRIYEICNQGGGPLPGALPDRPGEVPSQIADAGRTKELTGWRWQISLDQGLRRMVSLDKSA